MTQTAEYRLTESSYCPNCSKQTLEANIIRPELKCGNCSHVYSPFTGESLNTPAVDSPARITQALDALTFILAGNARFTIRSAKTGTRYTYKVREADEKFGQHVYWVNLLTGSDNDNDYTYMGMMSANSLRLTKKSTYTDSSLPVVAFRYMMQHLVAGNIPASLEIWHEGRCGRCGRSLTVPESVERGIGPECASKMGL